jgi:hypothetical protein
LWEAWKGALATGTSGVVCAVLGLSLVGGLTAAWRSGVVGAVGRRAAAQLESPTISIDLGGGTTLTLVRVPQGDAALSALGAGGDGGANGRTQPLLHNARAFYISASPVTQAQWLAVTGRLPDQTHAHADPPSGGQPVTSASWDDCRQFCRTLSSKAGAASYLHDDSRGLWVVIAVP